MLLPLLLLVLLFFPADTVYFELRRPIPPPSASLVEAAQRHPAGISAEQLYLCSLLFQHVLQQPSLLVPPWCASQKLQVTNWSSELRGSFIWASLSAHPTMAHSFIFHITLYACKLMWIKKCGTGCSADTVGNPRLHRHTLKKMHGLTLSPTAVDNNWQEQMHAAQKRDEIWVEFVIFLNNQIPPHLRLYSQICFCLKIAKQIFIEPENVQITVGNKHFPIHFSTDIYIFFTSFPTTILQQSF